MYTTEIVMHIVQSDRVAVVVNFLTFLLNPFVNRVNLRICILIVKFCRSTKLVLTCFGSGSPLTTFMSQPVQIAGEYRVSFSDGAP